VLVFLVLSWAPLASAQQQSISPEQHLEKGEYSPAITKLEKLASASRVPVDVVAMLARAYITTGQYSKAKMLVPRLRKSKAGKSAAAMIGGRVALLTGQYSTAIKAFRREVTARPTNWAARVLLAEARLAVGQAPSELAEADAMADFYSEERLSGGEALAWLGRALHMTQYFRDATDILFDARDADPRSVSALLHHADLFLTAENDKEADNALKAALALNPNNPDALAKMARIDLTSENEHQKAITRARKALKTNPRHVPALVSWARALLDIEQFTEALVPLNRALKTNPNDAEALGLKGACQRLLENTLGYKATAKHALWVNKRNALFFHTVAEMMTRHHRYAVAIELEHKALSVAPWYWQAKVGLGIGYSRVGNDVEANRYLQAAYEDANINTRAFNMTAHFYDGPAKKMEWLPMPPFKIRASKKEKTVLSLILPPFLKDAYATLKKNYGFAPKRPLHLEFFADRQTFSVRTVGYPNIGYQGVCFGHVVTAISPSVGDFNWGMTLWHELAHIWHLQMSRSRVPRWFTEGLAEFETTLRRPEWRREMDDALYRGLKNNKLLGVDRFNRMFINAKNANDITLAYYFASKVVAFIHKRWGFKVFPKMLREWGKGTPTPLVFKRILGLSSAKFDLQMKAHLKSDLLASRFNDFSPSKSAKGPLVAFFQGGEKALGAKNWEAAKGQFDAILKAGKDGFLLRLNAARAAIGLKDLKAARLHLEKAIARDPQERKTYRLLRKVLQKQGDAQAEYELLKKAALLDEHAVGLILQIVELARKAGNKADQIEYGRRALHIKPFDPRVLVAAGRAHLLDGNLKQARKTAELAYSLSQQKLIPAGVLVAQVMAARGKKTAARNLLKKLGAHPEVKAALDEL